MARKLRILAELVESRSYRTTLVAKDRLSENLERLVFGCEKFRTAEISPCDVTSFRVSRNDFRHYTPALLDQAAAELTIVVQRHGNGPGEKLIESWNAGDAVSVSEWASARSFRWPADELPVVLLGDATVISLALAMTERASSEGRDLTVILEVDRADRVATTELLPKATIVNAGAEPGAALDGWLHEDFVPAAESAPWYYLAGHGQSIQRQRAWLRETLDVDRRRVKTQPYWATGKIGL